MRAGSIPSHRLDRGFTLPEVMLAMTVLLFIVAALTSAVAAGQMQVYEAVRQVRGAALAEAMMEEILARPYADPQGGDDPGPDDGETDRADFDNADDFHDFTEDAGEIADFTGQAYPDAYAAFARSVTAAYTSAGMLDAEIAGLLVTVTVTDTDGREWVIRRFIAEEEAEE